jgi:4-phosphopantoate--beta-alanine ligase
MAMGKSVIVVDLNPLSRTAKMATITIVDELMRMAPLLLFHLVNSSNKPNIEWDNQLILDSALGVMLSQLE